MARPPQFERPDEDLTRDITAVKVAIKHLVPKDRAHLIAWMLLYYEDDGAMFSPQLSRRRNRITLNGVEYWLSRVPKRPRSGG
jgi:desulfoferrodoxin (superoxide reductase-like protein)